MRPVIHKDTPALEQVRAGIGYLDPVADHMRQGRLDNLQGTAKDFQSKWVRCREDPLQGERAPSLDREALAQERELLVLLREMIDLLPGTYRQVFKLRLYQGSRTRRSLDAFTSLAALSPSA